MFKSSDVSYWKTYNFNTISLIFGMGYGFCFNCLYRFLESLRKRTRFYLGLGCAKDVYPYPESIATSSIHSRDKCPTSFLKISLCTLITVYGRKHIGFTSYFNSKYTRSVFQVPSVPSNNSLNLCNNFSNSSRCVIVRCWHLVSITLCKSSFSYLSYNITRRDV